MKTNCRQISFSGLLIVLFLVSTGLLRAGAQDKSLAIQVASYLTAEDAQAEVNRLKAKKLEAYWVKAEVPGMGTRYRVRIGHFGDAQSAASGAAQACDTKAIKQYVISEGDKMPAGARPSNCGAASTDRREAKARQIIPVSDPASSVAAASRRAAEATKSGATSRATPAPMTKGENPSSAASIGGTPGYVGPGPATKGDTQASRKSVVAGATRPEKALTNPAVSATKAGREDASTAAGKSAAPVISTAPTATAVFEPAYRPVEIVTKALKYAVSRNPVEKTPVPVKIEAPTRSSESPRPVPDLSITNPKWKVSQNSLATARNLRAVYFVDAWSGWAAGDEGALFHSTDGGKKWIQIRSAALTGKIVDVNRIRFINENRGWMLADTRAKKEEDPQTVLLSTADGGKIWQNISMPGISSFCFIDEKKGWAAGRNATLLKTTDGGIKWRAVEGLTRVLDLPVGASAASFSFSDVYFLNAQIGWAVGNINDKTSSSIGGLFMTVDSGETWQRIPIALQRKSGAGHFARGRLLSVRFTTVSHGIIGGEMEDGDETYSFTLKTVDGGETWEQTRIPAIAAQTTQFVDAARGWSASFAGRTATGRENTSETRLMRTVDGGKSWETDLVSRGNQIRGVFFISPSKGWAVGDRGMILRYDSQ